mmetsp:Transcript_47795/g.138160  ORF Transcript_47795/g.138160 Transcript_47795/m.138160 type:complete len:292 (-) Transcript_47795:190-1065(-)
MLLAVHEAQACGDVGAEGREDVLILLSEVGSILLVDDLQNSHDLVRPLALLVVAEDRHTQHGLYNDASAMVVVVPGGRVELPARGGADVVDVQEAAGGGDLAHDALADGRAEAAHGGSGPRVELPLVAVHEHDHGGLGGEQPGGPGDDVLVHVVQRPLALQLLRLVRIQQQQWEHANEAPDDDANELPHPLPPLGDLHGLLCARQGRSLYTALPGGVLHEAPREDTDAVREGVAQRRGSHRREAAGHAERAVDDVAEGDHHGVVQHPKAEEGQGGGQADLFELHFARRANL